MTKQELRKKYSEIRKMIQRPDMDEKDLSDALYYDIRVYSSMTISIYVSYGSEAPTHELIRRLLRLGKRVCVPLSYPDGEMVMKEISSFSQLSHTDHHGILIPDEELKTIPKEQIDCFIVPGLAFTSKGKRLGYGGGYYDRYLKDAIGLKIGFCYREQIRNLLPTDENDITMDVVKTI